MFVYMYGYVGLFMGMAMAVLCTNRSAQDVYVRASVVVRKHMYICAYARNYSSVYTCAREWVYA